MADITERALLGLGFESAYLPFLQKLQELEDVRQHADFTVKLGERAWKVHKAIVCPQSEYFSKACNGEFMEAQRKTISLDDENEEEDAISAMMHFFNHFDYDSLSVTHDIDVYVVADKYLVYPLRQIAFDRIRNRLSTEWNTLSLASAVLEIYSLDSVHMENLKPILFDAISENRALISEPETYKAFHEALCCVSGFAVDVLMATAQPARKRKTYKCPYCDVVFSMHSDIYYLSCPGCNRNHPREWWDRHESEV